MKRIYTAVSGVSIYFLTLPTFVAAQSVGRGNGNGNAFGVGNGNGNGFGLGNGNGNGNAYGLGGGNGSVNPVSVPEIDASTGALALAALGAALLLVWEINRRRKSV